MPAPSAEILIESDPALAILKRKHDFADISSVRISPDLDETVLHRHWSELTRPS